MSSEDIAQEVELREWELNNASRPDPKRFKPDEPGYGPEFCAIEICGTEIPAARRAWGVTICVGCQSAKERKSAQHR